MKGIHLCLMDKCRYGKTELSKPEEDPTLDQISDKSGQCLVITILNSKREIN